MTGRLDTLLRRGIPLLLVVVAIAICGVLTAGHIGNANGYSSRAAELPSVPPCATESDWAAGDNCVGQFRVTISLSADHGTATFNNSCCPDSIPLPARGDGGLRAGAAVALEWRGSVVGFEQNGVRYPTLDQPGPEVWGEVGAATYFAGLGLGLLLVLILDLVGGITAARLRLAVAVMVTPLLLLPIWIELSVDRADIAETYALALAAVVVVVLVVVGLMLLRRWRAGRRAQPTDAVVTATLAAAPPSDGDDATSLTGSADEARADAPRSAKQVGGGAHGNGDAAPHDDEPAGEAATRVTGPDE